MLNLLRKSWNNTQDKVQEALKNGALIIDVRSPQEFAAGHIKGSENIPLDQLEEKMEEIRKQNKAVVTVCRSGARSSVARVLLKAGHIEAYNGGSWFGLLKTTTILNN